MAGELAGTVVERSAERMKFFTDAVVAIAMTLLILPLLESVAEAAADHLTTSQYLQEHGGQLFSFALSFVIIATFWMGHHGLYEQVAQYSGALLWLNVAWMFTIVWLAVATAMVGSMETDALQKVVYIGTMLATSLVTLGSYLYLLRHPDLLVRNDAALTGGLAAAIALSTLFALALAVALVVPRVDYLAMFVLLLTGPLQRVLATRLRSRRA